MGRIEDAFAKRKAEGKKVAGQPIRDLVNGVCVTV